MVSDRNKWLLGGAAAAGGVWWLCRRRAPPGTAAATSFEAYMRSKDVRPGGTQSAAKRYDPTDFSSYLRGGNGTAAGPTAAMPQQQEAVPLDAKPVLILFGTEYGFSKEVAEKAGEQMKAAGYWPQIVDMAEHAHGLASLGQQQALLVVCSTQGDGVPPTEAREFCDWLGSGKAPELSGLPFSVCALGDRSYQHFCRCGKTLDARLEALGGLRFAPRTDVNKEDWKAIDSWIEAVAAGLGALPLKTLAELGGASALAAEGPEADTRRWSRSRPYDGKVVALEPLCTLANDDDKNTWRVEIDLGDSGLEYAPGDALGIWPANCPEAVADLLSELGADGSLHVRLPSWHYADASLAEGAQSLPLSQALARCYDLRQPKHELLTLLLTKLRAAAAAAGSASSSSASPATTNGQAAAAPAGLSGSGLPAGGKRKAGSKAAPSSSGDAAANGHANGANSNASGDCQLCTDGCLADKIDQLAALCEDPAAAEKYLEPRHVVDVLSDFCPAALTPGELLGCLRQLAPRLYSISSSMLENPRRVQATIAVVRYESLGRKRLGVASTHVCERLSVGQAVPIYISKNPDFRLPAEHTTPIIMVGPGTGLAPFRSFMQDRILTRQATGKPFGHSLLFFGCRRRDQDYLYGQLLEDWSSKGLLTLRTAFSREQAHKVYVQQRLAEEGDLVWGLLQAGGHFYVCGDAANMAGQVEEALLDIVEARQRGGGGRAAAQAFLDGLSAAGRYQRDVWF